MENFDDFAERRVKDIQEEDKTLTGYIDNLFEQFKELDKQLSDIKEKLK